MDRGAALLRDLQDKLKAWTDYIRRCTNGEVAFVQKSGGEFDLVVRWPNKGSSAGEHVKSFTRQFVFGGTFSLSPNAWAIEKRACDHARDVVREVLAKRGV
jgi:hypothetical protein